MITKKKSNVKVVRVVSFVILALYFVAVLNNAVMLCKGLAIGENVVSVGAGYKFITTDDRPQFVYAQSYSDSGTTKYRIKLVLVNQDGSYEEYTLVNNLPSSVNSLCIASNHKLYFILSNGEIWMRNSQSTNTLDFVNDKDYFIKIGKYSNAYGLTPIGNRIYFFTTGHDATIYYIDISNYGAVRDFASKGYWWNVRGLAANNKYLYVIWDKFTGTGYHYIYLYVYDHAQEQIQSINVYKGYSPGINCLLISNAYLFCNEYEITLKDDKTLNWSKRKSISFDGDNKQNARECYGTNIAVYLCGSEVCIFPLDSKFTPDGDYTVTIHFVNIDTGKELSNVYVKGYVYYNGEIIQTIDGYYDYHLTLTVPAGSTVEIGQAHKDSFESSLEKSNYSLVVLNIDQDTERTIYFYPTSEGETGTGGMTGNATYNVTLRFVNVETGLELSNVYIKGYVYYNGEIYQSIDGYYDYNLILTVPAGSYIEIQQAHKDLFESSLERGGYYLTVVNVQSDTERTIYFYPQVGTTYLEFYFIDAKTNAQIPSVYLHVEDDEGNVIADGIYDYQAQFTVYVGKTYYWNASKSGYFNASGNVFIGTDQLTYFVTVYLTPIETPHQEKENNTTTVAFIVKSPNGFPIQAVVTLNGVSKVTNSQGYVYFEVQKNNTYSWLVQAEGYYSKSGTVEVGTNPVLVEVTLSDYTPVTITVTPIPGGGGDGGGGSGGGSGGDSSSGGWSSSPHRGSLDEGLNTLYTNAGPLIQLCILVTILGLLQMAIPRRRR